jgi:glycosyltransferase involved in cell wall biosynthesis
MFSVVIPIYNHARFVRQAIWSALRCPLVQEILVVDDGSKDGSDKIAASLARAHSGRVRDLTPPSSGNRGAHHRLNELVEQAHCEWVAVLNSDDAFVSGRFEAIVRDPEFSGCDFAFGNVLLMNERGALMGAKRGPLDSWAAPFRPSFDLLRMLAERRFAELMSEENYLITTSNMVFRKTLHARIGGFRSYRYVHDWDFALRAMVHGRAAYVRRFLTAYRIHSRNTILESERKALMETRSMLDNISVEFSGVLEVDACSTPSNPETPTRSERRKPLEDV